MIFLLISDIHDRYGRMATIIRREIYDVLIIAGDFTYGGDIDHVYRAFKIIRENTNKLVFFVPGNCDPVELLEFEDIENKIYNLHKKAIKINGLYLVGLGGSNITPFNTPIEFTEQEIASILDNIHGEYRADRTIVVSHVPPYNTVDILPSGIPIGSIALREFIERVQPLAVFCGHVHENQKFIRHGSTIIVNPGPAMHGKYAVISIKDTINVELKAEH